MRPNSTASKSFPWVLLILGLLLLAAVATVGLSLYQMRYPSWYEEVRLLDGRLITIHQKREYYENYGTAQSWVTIDLPELGGKRVWHSYLMPQRVDVADGKVYVFGLPRGDRQLQRYQFPKHYMVAFQWTGVEFSRIPFLQVPEQVRREENVYPCIPLSTSGKLEAKFKETTWCPPRGDKGQLTKRLDLSIYSKVADEWAALYRWENRSD